MLRLLLAGFTNPTTELADRRLARDIDQDADAREVGAFLGS